MRGFFENIFDFNHDGKMSMFESAAELAYLNESARDDDGVKTELELSGLDPYELEFMDAEERREVLESVGLDPDEYDF